MGRPQQELAEFLRSRRARISPETLGFPVGRKRRTPGLRREEVASAAGVGLTWYTCLEQGKDIRVSTAFLNNLAEALRLSAAERDYLFALARKPPKTSEPDLPINYLSSLQAVLDAILVPAYARNNRFDVVAWNAANTEMFGDFSAIRVAERNLVWLMFKSNYLRQNMPDWEANARSLVAEFRMALAQSGGAGQCANLIEKLSASSDEFRRMWALCDVSNEGAGVTRVNSAKHGNLSLHHHVLTPRAYPHLRIVVLA